MGEIATQTYRNHRRLDPWYHFFILPVLGIALLAALWRAIQAPALRAVWEVVAAAAFVVLALKARTFALKAQDRVIRLEERLRLQALLSEPLRSRVGSLTESQLIGLRFASDAEAAGLVQAALDENLGGEAIKKRIQTWRPDTFRV